MRKQSEILLYSFILLISACRTKQEGTDYLLKFDIKHYCNLTDQNVSGTAQAIEKDGRRPKDVIGFKKIDSCLILRKQLIGTDGDSVIIKETTTREYKKYLQYLSRLGEDFEDFQTIYNYSHLLELPPKINLEYISNLVRLEHAVIEYHLLRISPTCCGYGNRVFPMQETKPFIKDGMLEVLLISDFSTSRVRNFGLIFTIDSIVVNNKKRNVLRRFKTIDRVGL
jgi:hypothetical protein